MIWIFGSARTGSTWLVSMMGGTFGNRWWREPLVGALFGNFHDNSLAPHFERQHFILSDATRESWLAGIRAFVLNAVGTHYGGDEYVTVAEPNGTLGASLLMEALPESRMVLLVRDPRDVVASVIDASREGAWHHERRKNDPGWTSSADEDPDTLAQERAERYLQQVGAAKRAYDAHTGPKVLVRYEELRADTLGTMKRLYSALGVPVDEGGLARVVHKHSWENIPEEKRGEGKFYRKARPGGWREDLTAGQVAAVEEVTAPLLEELYPEKT